MRVGLLRREPHRSGLLATDHQVHIVLRAQTVCDCRQEAVGIRRQVHPSKLGLEIEDGANERRVLVREAVVFLSRPSRGLDIVERATRLAPGRFSSHLGKLGVLHHHSLNDTEERLVGGEETRATSEGVALQHALASMLGEDFDDASTLPARSDVPLEVTAGDTQSRVKLIGD